MVSVQIYDVSEDIAQLKGDSGEGLVATVEVIHACDGLVEDHFAVPRVNRDLFYDVPLSRYGHGVEVSQAGAGHIYVPKGEEVDVTGDKRECVITLRGEVF